MRQERNASWPKLLLLGGTGIGFWTALFGVAYRVLHYTRGVAEIGDLLAAKVLGIILLAFLSILLLSNVITALSTFFLAKDLDLLVSAPIGWFRLYLCKLGETIVHSSWMVALLALPILTKALAGGAHPPTWNQIPAIRASACGRRPGDALERPLRNDRPHRRPGRRAQAPARSRLREAVR